MGKNFFWLFILVVTAGNQQTYADGTFNSHHDEHAAPQPYKFGYEIKDKEGSQFRHESGDGHGAVRGSYGYVDDKGIHREVHYVADKGGFRAKVITNEPGTANQDSADVHVQATPSHHNHQEHHVSKHQLILHHEHVQIQHHHQPVHLEQYHHQHHDTHHHRHQNIHHQQHHDVHHPQFYHSQNDHGFEDVNHFDHHTPILGDFHGFKHKPRYNFDHDRYNFGLDDLSYGHDRYNYGHDRHNYGYDRYKHGGLGQSDFHFNDRFNHNRFNHFGRYRTPSFIHYSLGGMGGHHF